LQEEQIYLSDTRALNHVLVRDTHVFDETPAMTSYVPFPLITVHELMDRAPDSEFYYCFGPGLISVRGDTHKKYVSPPAGFALTGPLLTDQRN
jgi:hypothetical protein